MRILFILLVFLSFNVVGQECPTTINSIKASAEYTEHKQVAEFPKGRLGYYIQLKVGNDFYDTVPPGCRLIRYVMFTNGKRNDFYVTVSAEVYPTKELAKQALIKFKQYACDAFIVATVYSY